MKVYLASGWFNDLQERDLIIMTNACKILELEYFSPREVNLANPDDDTMKLKEVFDVNLKAIHDCDVIIVNPRDKDMGTVFEAGYAYCHNKTIVYFATFLTSEMQFNLMLAQSAAAVTKNYVDLVNVLGKLKQNPNYTRPYIGEIE